MYPYKERSTPSAWKFNRERQCLTPPNEALHITACLFPLDYLTVSETAKEPPQDEEGKNSPQNLAIEATYVNQNFSQQMLLVRAWAQRGMPVVGSKNRDFAKYLCVKAMYFLR